MIPHRDRHLDGSSFSKAADPCDTCGEQVSPHGHYLVTMVRATGNNASWKFDKIQCVWDFAIGRPHLDAGLEDPTSYGNEE